MLTYRQHGEKERNVMDIIINGFAGVYTVQNDGTLGDDWGNILIYYPVNEDERQQYDPDDLYDGNLYITEINDPMMVMDYPNADYLKVGVLDEHKIQYKKI